MIAIGIIYTVIGLILSAIGVYSEVKTEKYFIVRLSDALIYLSIVALWPIALLISLIQKYADFTVYEIRKK